MNDNKIAYLITDIGEYGKFMSFCIEHDICVFRTYWDEREKGNRCYVIDWKEKRCYYADKKYYVDEEYIIVRPKFDLDELDSYYRIHYNIEM